MSQKKKNPIVGFKEEWDSFFKRHPSWGDTLDNLHKMFELTFIRNADIKSHADAIVFLMGRLCIEDFNEIFLLAANGYGHGSLKILRGLYERVVTISYISKDENEAEAFFNYRYVQEGKLFKHAETFFGNIENYFGKDNIRESRKHYEKYKDDFRYTVCKKCNKTATMHSWSKLDLASMAKKTDLHELYFPGYLVPTLQAHATTLSFFTRLKCSPKGGFHFDESSQPDVADKSLIVAHNLIIRLLKIQNEYFNLGFDSMIQNLLNDFKVLWEKNNKKKFV